MEEKEITQLLSSRRILTIDGEKHPFCVSPRPLSTEDVKQLRARWKELHTGMPMSERDAQYKEIERLRQWVSDLQSGMFINCVYCGHRYGPQKNTPVSMADVLKAHVEICPEHPMSKLKARAIDLRNAARMAQEELVFGGDWETAKSQLQLGIDGLQEFLK